MNITPLAPFRVATVQDAVTNLHRCVVEINVKAEVKDGCSPREGAGSRREQSGEFCHRNGVETVQDAVAKLHRCVVTI